MTVERARLRSLRLVGFKSFAERTTLEFGPGISAIVGPNGSGKSNLADALRWALGEQGRQLRTRRSEDVIFAGSAARHATGMADVALVLENGDGLLPVEYAQVALGRRLYRSGENEYLLNGQRVRLRDLLDLLDGANLADNAFLFIGQGMVDQALSLRPEERRPLFEEAAGVRRHERRRRQAEAQLEEAEANLARVRDIVAELRPQARRLAAQAEQQAAREDAAEELAGALVASARARWAARASAATKAEAEVEAARRASDLALRDLGGAEDQAAALLTRISERGALVRVRRETLDAARARVTEARLAAGRHDAAGEALRLERQRTVDERAAAGARAAQARRVLAADIASSGRDALEAEAAERSQALERELAVALAELAQAEAPRRVADERARSRQRAEEARAAELAHLRSRAAEARRQATRAEDAAALAERAALEAAAQAEGQRQALADALAAHGDAERSLAAARDGLLAADALRAGRAGEADRLTAAAAGLRGRLEALEGELRREASQRLLAAARRRGGRRIADGLQVEPSLRQAVAAALGPALRAPEVARETALALRGEAGHLVLAGVGAPEPRGPAQTLLEAARAAGGGHLPDAVREDPGGTVSRLLRTSVWVPDLAAAVALRERLPVGWQAVTPAGELVRADGLVQLGRPDALLERRAERDRLALETAAIDGELAAARERVAAAVAEAEEAAARAEEARLAAEAARRAERAQEEAERLAAGRAETAGREAAWMRAQADRLAGEARRAEEAAASSERAASGTEEAPGRSRARAGSVPPGAGRPSADDGDDAAIRAWQGRIADLRTRREAVAAELERMVGERRAAEDLRRRAELSLALEEERIADLDRRLAEVAAAEGRLDGERSAAAGELALARDAEAKAAASLGELDVDELADRERLAQAERAAGAAREELRRAQERTRAAEIEALQARLGLDTLREGLLVELAGLGPPGLRALVTAAGEPASTAEGGREASAGLDEAAAAELEAALDRALAAWSQAPAGERNGSGLEAPGAARMAALRRRYQEVGQSNPFATQEYAEVKARLDALEAQQADLEQAIAVTRRLIAELGERIAEQFRATFRALEGAFARRFEQLFDGGDAQLLLTEPDDLSATGIEIMARPPGKKRQALAMLSGGERALTAVALLFAMLDVRPVPFCVLDEVDAALDEANVTRFNEALRELAASTQFVVITHNRGTIEAADALYGITIGDDAVSRVIALRLADTAAAVPAAG